MRRPLPSLAAAALIAVAGSPVLAASNILPPPDGVYALRTGVDYRISPGDALSISVDQLEALTKEFQVGIGGGVLLPLIGEVQAAGRTPSELSNDIAERLKEKYMKDPQVVVGVTEAQGQRVTVDGAVSEPGVYPLTGPTTLLQAVALASGPDPKLANPKRVAIFRTVGGERRSAIYDLTDIRDGEVADPQIYGNDIVVVDSSGTKSFFQNFQGGFGLIGMILRPW